jgi:hypothetical protein
MKRLLILSERTHELLYSSRDELFDKIAGLPKELRDLINMSKSLGAQNSDPMAGGYESSLVIENGDAAFDTAAEVYAAVQVAAGVTARIWEMTVPPRYLYVWGSGIYGAMNNQGYARLCIMDVSTAFQVGTVGLVVESYDRYNKKVVKAFVDSLSHLADKTSVATAYATNNQVGMVAIPKTTVIAAPYSRLAVDYKVITNVGGGLDTADFRLPVTVKSS